MLAGPFREISTAMRRDVPLLLLFVLLGAVIRLDLLCATNFGIDSDEAIVGLMAKHFIEGKGLPIFYYGQDYMGSLEPLLVALLFLCFGVSSVALLAVPLLFSLLLIPLIYLLGKELAGARVGRWAALLAAVAPQSLIVWGSKARGGFIEVIVIGVVALLLAVRWYKQEQPSPTSAALIGALLGLGWWVNNQILFFMVPVGTLFLSGVPRVVRRAWWGIVTHAGAGLAGFVVGGAPFWWHNLTHQFASFKIFQLANNSTLLEHLAGVFSVSFPVLFGAQGFWEAEERFPGAVFLSCLLYGSIFAIVLLTRRSELAAVVCRGTFSLKSPLEILHVFVATTLGAFVMSSFGHLYGAPRYLLPLYVALFIYAGFAVQWLRHNSKVLGTLLLSAVLLFNLASSYPGRRIIPGEPFVAFGDRVTPDHTDLISWLKSHDVKWIRTGYWIGYRLAFETREQVRFRIFQEPYQERIGEYVQARDAPSLDEMPYVVTKKQAEIMEPGLRESGFNFERAEASGYVILHHVLPITSRGEVVSCNDVRLEASYQPESAANACDGALGTRWGSAHPQTPGMTFSVDFSPPIDLAGFKYRLGAFRSDAPRGLQVQRLLANGSVQNIITEEGWRGITYLSEERSDIIVRMTPQSTAQLRFTQTGEHPIFDWSIAELEFFKE